MNVYTIMMFIIWGAGILYSRSRYNYNAEITFLTVSCLAMFFVCGFRDAYTIGNDSSGAYYLHFLRISQGTESWKVSSNIGFYFLMKIVAVLTNTNYQIFVTGIASFVFFTLYKFTKKYSYNCFISVMWYIGMSFFVQDFIILKQSVAMAILWYAFDALIEERQKRFYVFVFVAALFHAPALIFLPAYIFSKSRSYKNILIVLGIVLTITYVFRSSILKLMMSFYYEGNTELISSEDVKFIGVKVAIMIAIVCFAVITKKTNNGDRLYNTLLIFMGVSIVLQTFCYYDNIFERLADYYFQFSILFLPLLFVNIDEDDNSIMVTGSNFSLLASIVVGIFATWRLLTYVQYGYAMLPYSFFWN